MKNILSLVFKYLPYLVTASKSVPELITFISNLRAIFARTNVWTDSEEEKFDNEVAALKDDPYWKEE